MKPTICGGDACFAAAASRDRARRSCRFATALSGADLGHSTLGFGAGSVVAGRDERAQGLEAVARGRQQLARVALAEPQRVVEEERRRLRALGGLQNFAADARVRVRLRP